MVRPVRVAAVDAGVASPELPGAVDESPNESGAAAAVVVVLVPPKLNWGAEVEVAAAPNRPPDAGAALEAEGAAAGAAVLGAPKFRVGVAVATDAAAVVVVVVAAVAAAPPKENPPVAEEAAGAAAVADGAADVAPKPPNVGFGP